MEAKDIKAALKSAREAIRNKEYKDALKHCKSVLKSDKSNYNALVFVGVAAEGLEQSEQAVMAYTKATQVDPSQLLAWQGLCGFYEKANKVEYSQPLVDVYLQLLKFNESDEAKYAEVSFKLCNLYEALGESSKALEQYVRQISRLGEDWEKCSPIWKQVIDIVSALGEPNDDEKELLVKGYQFWISKCADDDELYTIWIAYINWLSEQQDRDKLKQEWTRLGSRFPSKEKVIIMQSKMWLEEVISAPKSVSSGDIQDYLKMMETQKDLSNSVTSKYLQVLQLFITKKAVEAKETILVALREEKQSIIGWTLYSWIMNNFHDHTAVIKGVTYVLKLLDKDIKYLGDKPVLTTSLKQLMALSLIGLGKPESTQKALELLKEEVINEGDRIKVEAFLKLGRFDEAKELINTGHFESEAQKIGLLGWQSFLENGINKAQECLELCVEKDPDNSLNVHRLGQVYWKKVDSDASFIQKAFKTFLNAAKIDPFFSVNFLYMGYYYKDFAKDMLKALKCFRKAFELDKDNDEIGIVFADTLAEVGEMEECLAVLRSVTTAASAGSCKWGWLRLGLFLLKTGEHTPAIASLQAALRADPHDEHCWECLGEAYMKRGSYNAAMKAFMKTIEINPDAIYSRYQLAAIKQILGTYVEAVEAYNDVLQKKEDYVPALKGIGETYLLLAKVALKEFFHGRALQHCQEASNFLTRAAVKRPDLSCIWKLLGDVYSLLYKLPGELVHLDIDSILLSETKNEKLQMNKEDIMSLGARCYGMAIKQMPECSSLWQDLGVNYYQQATLAPSAACQNLISQSVMCLQKAASLDKSNFQHWLMVGTICAQKSVGNLSLAQHCLIKSIELEPNNVNAWTHLGIIYIQNDSIRMANEAFKMAQSLEPSYVCSWLGQAMLAETIGREEEAMDLFRHATELNNHTEGSIGYAHWVCGILQNKEKLKQEWNSYVVNNMNATAAASDALHKLTERDRSNPCALNMYGLLLERQGLLESAVKAFEMCLGFLNDDSSGSLKIDLVRANYARVLCSSNRYEESASQYNQLGDKISFEQLCGLALAYYKMNQPEESKEIYLKALKVASSDADRSHVDAAIGIVEYSKGDLDGARAALFRSSQSSDPSAVGLLCLCALGMIQQDVTLTSAVIAELHDKAIDEWPKFIAESLILQGKVEEARDALQKATELEDNGNHWKELLNFMIRHMPESCENIIAAAISNIDTNVGVEQISIGLLATGSHSLKTPTENALSAAKKAVHLNPTCMSSWVCLLSCGQAEQVVRQAHQTRKSPLLLAEALLPLTSHVMAAVEEELREAVGRERSWLQTLHVWCVRHYVVSLLNAGRLQQAQHFLQQATWLYDSDDSLTALQARLMESFPTLRSCVGTNSFHWNMLADIYAQHKLIAEGIETFREWQRKDDQWPVASSNLARWLLQNAKGTLADEEFKSVLDETMTKSDSFPTVVLAMLYLLHGINALLEDNQRLARRFFQQCLDTPVEADAVGTRMFARQHLFAIHAERNDKEALKELEKNAEAEGDVECQEWCKKLLEK